MSSTAWTLNEADLATATDECSTIQQQMQKLNFNGVLSFDETSQLLSAR